eukprot:gnl/TRDRNA2_/TRDRNA2_146322_c0_seq1.p1 gnl/TRDRNA2_/TRDRNA2_146322_c0~~gnl/TRDRNA2_/TRDRNA2_146322_c0_seq1.p1  ORF type:complete len:237 (+),score=36.64 gnl/TRDRNA2_/TRDRNA2_146322_c0_seq1:2-712(+)
MVSEVYSYARISSDDAETRAQEEQRLVSKMVEVLPRLHALAIGPGLGRHEGVLRAVGSVIQAAKSRGLPLVIDADGLWLINQKPDLVKGYEQCVLTPNVMEIKRLAKSVLNTEDFDLPALCDALGGPTILQKGAVDRICAPGIKTPLECAEEGAPRRPGGLGDFLAGSLSVLLHWSKAARQDQLRACQAACVLVRRACRAAYAKHLRAMVAPDVLQEVGAAFEALCPADGRRPSSL